MEKRLCRLCGNEYPATEEYFYKRINKSGTRGLRTECKACKDEMKRYREKLKRAIAEQAQKNAWMVEKKNQKFVCKLCGQEKSFGEMRLNTTLGYVQSLCKKCYNQKAKDYRANHEANVFGRVLEERRERLKKENQEK